MQASEISSPYISENVLLGVLDLPAFGHWCCCHAESHLLCKGAHGRVRSESRGLSLFFLRLGRTRPLSCWVHALCIPCDLDVIPDVKSHLHEHSQEKGICPLLQSRVQTLRLQVWQNAWAQSSCFPCELCSTRWRQDNHCEHRRIFLTRKTLLNDSAREPRNSVSKASSSPTMAWPGSPGKTSPCFLMAWQGNKPHKNPWCKLWDIFCHRNHMFWNWEQELSHRLCHVWIWVTQCFCSFTVVVFLSSPSLRPPHCVLCTLNVLTEEVLHTGVWLKLHAVNKQWEYSWQIEVNLF